MPLEEVVFTGVRGREILKKCARKEF
jgi:hypothetical protein